MVEHSKDVARIRSIAARSASLWDRKPGSRRVRAADDARARERLARWREILGSEKILHRRLRNGRVDPHVLDRLLRGSLNLGTPPSWTTILESALRLSSSRVGRNTAGADRSFDPAHPLPFQDILVGFMRQARRLLAEEAGLALRVFRDPAIVDLERQLLAHLTFVAGLTIGRDFYAFRFAHAPASAIEAAWERQPASTQIYSRYVRHMQAGGLLALLDAHPVLARLLSQSVEQWVQTSARLCRRFVADFGALRALFGWSAETADGAVASLRTDLSDRHHGGQTVTELLLHTGERVIYKPRTVQPEIVFSRFVDWLNGRGLSFDLRSIAALDRVTHGWVEFVPCEPCTSDAQVSRFYARSGMLLCVLHALATTDVHSENVIACGEHPVIVDPETLLCESVREPSLSDRAKSDEATSVLRTGVLPRWQTGAEDNQFDASALGADDAQDSGIRLPEWRSINTDQMAFSGDGRARETMTHRVDIAGAWPTVADYLTPFLEGFKEAYACLLANRRALLSNDQLLNGFDRLELRVLLRDSATYARLHLHLLHPEFMVDGIVRSIELEWLARPLSATNTPRANRNLVYEAERSAMESLDIPHFATSGWSEMSHTADDLDLWRLGAGRDSRMLRRRLEELSEADCARQLTVIEDAVRSRFGRPSVVTERRRS